MTQFQRIARRMGFRHDQDGIINRYMRERTHWKMHLENTRNFITNSFADRNIKKVAVLGSGWLLDVPLAEMTDRFDRIYLVDIIHPPQIRRKVRNFSNVELVEEDLSGGAVEQLWQITRNKGFTDKSQISDLIKLSPPLDHIQTDAFISVNLLNQLDIILCDYLLKKGYFEQVSPDRFRSMIQSFHLEWITRVPGCIISDTFELEIDRSGKALSKSLLYAEFPTGHRSDSWTWEFDTQGTYRPGIRTQMQVQAVEWA